MISALLDRAKDVIVRLAPAPRRGTPPPGGAPRVQIYDAVVYGERISLAPPSQRSGYPPTLRDLPLAGVERVTIKPADYDEYLAQFIEGEKGLPMMRSRLMEAMSPGLTNLLSQPPFDLRVWWSSAAPELDDLPWELTADPHGAPGGTRVVFLRGVPPDTPLPTVPVTGEPRLAIIGARTWWPPWAGSLTSQVGAAVVPLDMPVREGIMQAVSQGIEMMHLVTDGTISSALEGVLYDHDRRRTHAELPPGELSRMLDGSRVALLTLSRAESASPDEIPLAGRSVLSAFRAFAYLGGSPLPLPSIVAALGPVDESIIGRFWEQFYRNLMSSWHLTGSLHAAERQLPYALPVALFCRHAGGKLFSHADASQIEITQPLAVRQTLLQSENLTKGLGALMEKYGELPASVSNLFAEENRRQDKLRGELGSWIKSTGEEL